MHTNLILIEAKIRTRKIFYNFPWWCQWIIHLGERNTKKKFQLLGKKKNFTTSYCMRWHDSRDWMFFLIPTVQAWQLHTWICTGCTLLWLHFSAFKQNFVIRASCRKESFTRWNTLFHNTRVQVSR
jgi:hypothetical protein